MKPPPRERTKEEADAYFAELEKADWIDLAGDDEYPADGDAEATVVFYGPEPPEREE